MINILKYMIFHVHKQECKKKYLEHIVQLQKRKNDIKKTD